MPASPGSGSAAAEIALDLGVDIAEHAGNGDKVGKDAGPARAGRRANPGRGLALQGRKLLGEAVVGGLQALHGNFRAGRWRAEGDDRRRQSRQRVDIGAGGDDLDRGRR